MSISALVMLNLVQHLKTAVIGGENILIYIKKLIKVFAEKGLKSCNA